MKGMLGLIVLIWLILGFYGAAKDDEMEFNWPFMVFITFIPFIPFVTHWCGIY